MLSRHHLTLAVDLSWVALSAMLAVLIRDNFVPNEPHLEAASAYAIIAVASSAVVFAMAGIHKMLWQYTSLPDVSRITAAVTVALLVALFLSFVMSRLEGVARSVPVIQWLLLVSATVGTRIGSRIWHERRRRDRLLGQPASVEHVLVVGLSHLSELYLEAVAAYAAKAVDIVGVLSEERELRGRLLRFHKVLGTPEELPQVLAQLEVHGITLDRIVVMQPFEELSRRAGEALLTVERASSIKVDWMVELLGFATEQRKDDTGALESSTSVSDLVMPSLVGPEAAHLIFGMYGYVKRAFDILAAISLSVLLAPLMLLLGLLVALDVGFPLVFWQKRPGRLGRPFKLFKFCTLRPAHDEEGRRIPEEFRATPVGELLRRSRLDELPQLYNIVVGEMSFVGPRPLLPCDQPEGMMSRLSVRPGLTGLAQVHGERTMPANDKNALDVWYIQNASLWMDIKILLRTLAVLIRGERVDHGMLKTAHEGIEPAESQSLGEIV